jgi:hypothetical protein
MSPAEGRAAYLLPANPIMKKLLLSVALLAGLPMLASAQIYSTTFDNNIDYFGSPNTATYGQTFVAPASVLDSWTLGLNNQSGGDLFFDFNVMAWNGSSATGSVLYQSSVQDDTGNQLFTFNPDLALTVGDTYVAFINESGLNDGASLDHYATQNGSNTASAIGGDFVFLNNGDDSTQLTSQSWSQFSVAQTAYTATFGPSNSVPDASPTLMLLVAALLSLGAIEAKRRVSVQS